MYQQDTVLRLIIDLLGSENNSVWALLHLIIVNPLSKIEEIVYFFV